MAIDQSYAWSIAACKNNWQNSPAADSGFYRWWQDLQRKPPPLVMAEAGRGQGLAGGSRDFLHRLGLRPLGTLDHLKLHLVAFI
jgi:hypothetical protein